MTASTPPPRPQKAPPPLPEDRRAAPHRRSSASERGRSDRRRTGSGKVWILGVVLVFAVVSAWGSIYRSRSHTETVEERMGWIVVRDRVDQERADMRAALIQQHLERANETGQVRRAHWAPLSEEQEAAAAESGLPVNFENALRMRFVLIPAGTFIMGSPGFEEGRQDDEALHNAALSVPFYMLTTEVSVELFGRFDETVLKKTGLAVGRRRVRGLPITQVSHERATAFCRWLEERDQERRYALPTEAQWEYACRAGTSGRFWWGEDASLAGAFANVADQALHRSLSDAERDLLEGRDGWTWFDADDGVVGVAPGGSFRANPWGLYDMLGNVREWCADWYGRYATDGLSDFAGPAGGQQRVLRGGSSDASVRDTRCGARGADWLPDESYRGVGFRVVSTPRG